MKNKCVPTGPSVLIKIEEPIQERPIQARSLQTYRNFPIKHLHFQFHLLNLGLQNRISQRSKIKDQ